MSIAKCDRNLFATFPSPLGEVYEKESGSNSSSNCLMGRAGILLPFSLRQTGQASYQASDFSKS
ncbi:hypothetical protein FD723_06850 [Nostoc sp. C052]|uniref:hypothetical protein n=1 Tax=Nostoc sp. C052 TaxID=2576902 RepID=UPI0015C3E3A7|nr:hypothetical protein [Nostoc sp. C052]QLE40199.1 hypothetical protein FD723_06850 [Nostoc sp. C052]